MLNIANCALHLHVDCEDSDVGSHADVHQSPERNVRRQSEVEEQEREFDNPVDEVVVYLFNEQDLEDLKLLQSTDSVHVSLQGGQLETISISREFYLQPASCMQEQMQNYLLSTTYCL